MAADGTAAGECRVDEMPYFDGAVAMDFGNTSSALTCLEAHAMNTDEIEIVDAELSPADPAPAALDLLLQDFDHTVPSAVRLFQFEPAPRDGLMPHASWCIGRFAKRTAGGRFDSGTSASSRTQNKASSGRSFSIRAVVRFPRTSLPNCS